MTIDEFIEAVNEGKEHAEADEQGTVYIYDALDSMVASLGLGDAGWKVETDTYIFPTVLRLMTKLADTPPAKRVEPPRYVILNGKPIEDWSGPHEDLKERTTTYKRYFTWHFFTIGNQGQYLVSQNTTDPEILTQCSYTREEVEEATEWLPEEWRSVINNLLTPLDVALEGKVNDHVE